MSKGQPDDITIEVVCNYMLQQNRPYSPVDVWNNLRQEYPKAQIIKCLDIGVERGILRDKLISKQKIYFADQSKIEKCSEEELQSLNESINEKKNRLNELNNEMKIAKNAISIPLNLVFLELKEYGSVLSIKEMTALQTTLKAQVPAIWRYNLKKSIKEMEERINGMATCAKDEVVNEKKKSELIAKQEHYKKYCKERKRIADQIVDIICENINTSKKKLMEDMGFELD
uniref:TBPIP domain-containing protein n=1 Tax=Elaeophora elaphi TaxID=1147741 RepID=A0A0R3S1R8_9BILA